MVASKIIDRAEKTDENIMLLNFDINDFPHDLADLPFTLYPVCGRLVSRYL